MKVLKLKLTKNINPDFQNTKYLTITIITTNIISLKKKCLWGTAFPLS
jgi:hypothetical protein